MMTSDALVQNANGLPGRALCTQARDAKLLHCVIDMWACLSFENVSCDSKNQEQLENIKRVDVLKILKIVFA
jgi:hypothetical protein